MPYAYHFDSALYGQFLRRLSEGMGVRRTEGLIEHVRRSAESGDVTSLVLRDGREITGVNEPDLVGEPAVFTQQRVLRDATPVLDHKNLCHEMIWCVQPKAARLQPHQFEIFLAHDCGEGV